MRDRSADASAVLFDPAVGRSGARPAHPSRIGRFLAWLFAVCTWLVVAPFAGAMVWFAYALIASEAGASVCGPGGIIFGPEWGGGGQASNESVITAAALGGLLWLVGCVAVWRCRHNRSVFFGSAAVVYLVVALALYAGALAALYYVSPVFWGPRHC